MAQLDLAPFKSRKRCSVPALPELEQADTAGEDRDLVSRRSTFTLREVRSATTFTCHTISITGGVFVFVHISNQHSASA